MRKTLEPVLKQLGDEPLPDQILGLKVCDPAMGSGAFLVEACRQLAEALVKAWASHGLNPHIPEDEDEALFARRLVAQRCLYGVDRNPMAVDLAKLSLWLATLAKDHPFTFLDHALRAGDSLVGLRRGEIAAFHWAPGKGEAHTFLQNTLLKKLDPVIRTRALILQSGDDMLPAVKAQKLRLADDALEPVRLLGDAVVAAFFAEDNAAGREVERRRLFAKAEDVYVNNRIGSVMDLDKAAKALRTGQKPVTPFHWDIEFPEVFGGAHPGFDAMVGNPPFAGKNTLIGGNPGG